MYIASNIKKELKRRVKYFGRKLWRVRYVCTRLVSRTDKKLWVFEAYQGRQYACSPRAVYEELQKKEAGEGHRFVWVFREPERYAFLKKNPNTEIVKLGSQGYYRAYAQAAYWIVNNRTRHCLVPGKDQIFLQTWHGTPLKRLGCDIEVEGSNVISAQDMKNDYKKEGERVTYFLSPSSFYSEKIASAFGLDENQKKRKLVELGYPRNDSLFKKQEETAKRVRKVFRIPEGKKVILYAPTFRDNQHVKNGCAFTLGFQLENFVRELGQEYVMLFRTHYFVTEQVDLAPFEGIIFDATGWDDINELYLASDLLVTDYSSVFFDYANLKRPMVFFMYDIEEYRDRIRDFYIDLAELPGQIVTEEKQLYSAIRDVWKKPVYDERYRAFHDKYNSLDGPDVARRVIDWIRERNE